ncbi:SDR family NAD(P)-dependent oxidoreductase [Rhodovibrio salinarum]|uniref:Oxidoreductase n=1 Tax=Rhodovibrio salinarum TaxID=1087 RepID=A0A934QK78_9PROT|nr:SDR family NAD(P)-dependent oxidoreductase [Rhodovibrio salinarum]MBK1698371.1 oxidoreductase [Rhodovibrio salinarum]
MTEQQGRLQNRIAVVTGASRGIGRAVAERFAAEGATVVAIGRTKGALEELDDAIAATGGPSPVLVPLDLRDFDALDRLGGSLFDRYQKVDILVGNAGALGQLGPMSHIPPDTWQEVMDINVTANFRLIRSLDLLLRQSDAGRAIFTTSGVARTPFAYFGAYAASKAALEHMVKVWAAELNKTNIRANLLDPGVVRTSMRAHAFPGEDPNQHPEPAAITERFVELAEPACTHHGEVVHV